MTPQTRRRIIPFIVLFAAGSILSVLIFGPKRPRDNSIQPTPEVQPAESVENKSTTKTEIVPEETELPDKTVENAVSNENLKPFEILTLVTNSDQDEKVTLGSLNEIDNWKMEVQFTKNGAAISSIQFSDIFETVDGKLAWKYYREKGGTKPPLDDLYLLANSYTTGNTIAPILGAFQIVINGEKLSLESKNVWTIIETTNNSVSFEATVVDQDNNKIATINRTWVLSNKYGIKLQQHVKNLTGQEFHIQWLQYGPPSLTVDRSRYMDRRRFRFGWELSEEFDPNHAAPIQSNDYLFEFADTTKQKEMDLWPPEDSDYEGDKLSWFASTNRYFALAVFPDVNSEGEGDRVFTNKVKNITCSPRGQEDNQHVLTGLWSPVKTLGGGDSFNLTMGVYAGPLQRSVLDNNQPYVALNMRDLVLYQMSSMCAICTFQWLADFLAIVLTTLDHYVVFDWGFAIILLVLIVRGILHPITKKSQINMQRFGKVMQKLKPEIDKLKQKYPDDPKRVQTEQMALMQKYGVNPLQMLGCLPMFLQMPIWVALYALLYFMFDIRQEPAFFGFFQMFGDWPFLADLSSSDHFFGQFAEPKHFFLWNITGINLLPVLMGVIFFVQQKYMSPQGMATTPEQASQQKIMRVMMVVLFPLMLYSAPSGLTLYILTSSTVGILESRRIRKHIDNVPLEPKPTRPTARGKKPKDKQGRAWAEAMEARRKKVQNKAKKRNFKKRG
jgi:YidC/Oxa1 family membrane protein insertase